jgi:hypothetical protein
VCVTKTTKELQKLLATYCKCDPKRTNSMCKYRAWKLTVTNRYSFATTAGREGERESWSPKYRQGNDKKGGVLHKTWRGVNELKGDPPKP